MKITHPLLLVVAVVLTSCSSSDWAVIGNALSVGAATYTGGTATYVPVDNDDLEEESDDDYSTGHASSATSSRFSESSSPPHYNYSMEDSETRDSSDPAAVRARIAAEKAELKSATAKLKTLENNIDPIPGNPKCTVCDGDGICKLCNGNAGAGASCSWCQITKLAGKCHGCKGTGLGGTD